MQLPTTIICPAVSGLHLEKGRSCNQRAAITLGTFSHRGLCPLATKGALLAVGDEMFERGLFVEGRAAGHLVESTEAKLPN